MKIPTASVIILAAAAISLLLLVVAAGLSALFVFRGGLFERD